MLLYLFMLITAVALWQMLEIPLIIAAAISVIFWGVIGPILGYLLKGGEKN